MWSSFGPALMRGPTSSHSAIYPLSAIASEVLNARVKSISGRVMDLPNSFRPVLDTHGFPALGPHVQFIRSYLRTPRPGFSTA